MDNSTLAEYLDWGGLLVFVRNQVLTDTLYYSFDEGRTLNSFVFTSRKMIVSFFFTLDSAGKRAVVIGRRPHGFVFIGIDFSDVYAKSCESTDYEDWTPPFTTSDNKGCVLGHKLTFKRKKPTSTCDSGGDFDKISLVTNCNCTENDYECDYGFERTTVSQRCVLEPGMSYRALHRVECENNPSGTYVAAGGYRKIPGDKCIHGAEKFAPQVRSCNPFHVHAWMVILAVLLSVILALAGALGYLVVSIRKGKIPEFLTKVPFVMDYIPVRTLPDDEVDDLLSSEFDHELSPSSQPTTTTTTE